MLKYVLHLIVIVQGIWNLHNLCGKSEAGAVPDAFVQLPGGGVLHVSLHVSQCKLCSLVNITLYLS
jgi:hypothetical protein